MAHVSSFTFENMSRIGNDSCCIDQTTIQDTQHCNYMLQNYFSADCTMQKPIHLATSQPCINYSGTHTTGAGGCNIDDNSRLMIGTIQTNPKCRIDLFQRPFATVPFLGRGSVCPIMESQMLQGDLNTNKKTVNKLSEKSYAKYSNTPMIPDVKKNIQNPANYIEGMASEGWIRGGVPSRELTRDRNSFNQQ